MGYRTPPEAVRELRRPWASLVDEIAGLTPEMEREFRFGQRVTYFNDAYRMGGNIKGGSSSIWYPATKAEYDAYTAWRERDGIPEVEDRAAFEELQDLLDSAAANLRGTGAGGEIEYQERFGPIYRITLEILSALPRHHLEGAEIAAIQLGGWGPDSAKASAYDRATVIMYDFALKGARRTYVGLLLHELGHANERRIDRAARDRLRKAYRSLARMDALIGVEYLFDEESRKAYQLTSFNEFLAESYLIYMTHGERLRREKGDADGEATEAWATVYSVFRDTFGGMEYA